jgi:hypothetical protein
VNFKICGVKSWRLGNEARSLFQSWSKVLIIKLHNWIPTTEMVIRPAHAPPQVGWSLQLQ